MILIGSCTDTQLSPTVENKAVVINYIFLKMNYNISPPGRFATTVHKC